MTTWDCPLCPFRTTGDDVRPSVIRHATTEHPAYLPDSATIADILASLPHLLREAALTVDAPNPDGPEVTVTRGARREELVLSIANPDKGSDRWSRTPKRVRTMRALDPALDSSLFASLLMCSRLVWESFDATARSEHPQPQGTPTWVAELAWLSSSWQDAQAYLDAVDFAWIGDELRSVWHSVAAMAGVRKKPRNLCPDCGAPLHLDSATDWMTCDAGHQHPGPRRLEAQWRRKPPMSSREVCEALKVPRGTLHRWVFEKRIKPTRTEGQVAYFLPWDVIGVKYPDIVAEINERDVA